MFAKEVHVVDAKIRRTICIPRLFTRPPIFRTSRLFPELTTGSQKSKISRFYRTLPVVFNGFCLIFLFSFGLKFFGKLLDYFPAPLLSHSLSLSFSLSLPLCLRLSSTDCEFLYGWTYAVNITLCFDKGHFRPRFWDRNDERRESAVKWCSKWHVYISR